MDGKVKIWQQDVNTGNFELQSELVSDKPNAHEDWVRDVAWCNNIGVMKDMIATVGEDKLLRIWKCEANPLNKEFAGKWVLAFKYEFREPVWRCSWSPIGFMLAVSGGDNVTRVFQEVNTASHQVQEEVWRITQEIDENGQMQQEASNGVDIGLDGNQQKE